MGAGAGASGWRVGVSCSARRARQLLKGGRTISRASPVQYFFFTLRPPRGRRAVARGAAAPEERLRRRVALLKTCPGRKDSAFTRRRDADRLRLHGIASASYADGNTCLKRKYCYQFLCFLSRLRVLLLFVFLSVPFSFLFNTK